MLFLIPLIIIGCNSPSNRKEELTVYNQTNVEYQQVDEPDSSCINITFPEIFQNSYSKEFTYKDENGAISFYTYDYGHLNVESGRLIACDPVVMHDAIAFKETFPIGHFPVKLAMAKMKNDERVAYSKVLFSDSCVVKWEYALLPGQEPISLKDSTFYCYGVDAGTGIFIDSVANDIASNFDHKTWEHVFITMAEKNKYRGHTYEFSEHNLATFSTGYGDGCYATYIGYDINGNICQLLTDFGLIAWWEIK